MSIRREWLNWKDPCLPQAAALIIERALADQPSAAHAQSACDLRQFTCVLPGNRAGRLLLGQLIQNCQSRALRLLPPKVLTPGQLIDALADDQPIATPTEVTFAWMKALREAERDAIKPLLPYAPTHDDALAWHELASTIAKVHADLAGGLVTFARVADQAERMEMFAEGERWRAMEHVYGLYRRTLNQCGLLDPHHARQLVIEQRMRDGWPDPIAHAWGGPFLLLIGVTELNAMQRAFIASAGERVVAMIHAPQELCDRFDEFGCVVAQQWKDIHIGIADSQIRVVDKPDDQAQQMLRAIAELNGRYSAEQITLGLGDESMTSVMQRGCEWAGLSTRAAAGKALRHTPPLRFLQAVADWLNEPRFANFAALLRHPDVEQWILDFGLEILDSGTEQATVETTSESADPKSKIQNPKSAITNWLTLLDEYFSDHLHARLTGTWLGNSKRRERLGAVYNAVHHLLAPLLPKVDAETGKKKSRRVLCEWGQPILDVLAMMYEVQPDHVESELDQTTASACMAIREHLAELTAIPAELQPQTDAAAALRVLLQQVGRESIVDELQPNQIEMLGWFELHLDLAPALIITGFNDGCIPRSAPSGPFLPDSLRSKLGLANSAQRYARDAYLIEAIRHSREHLTLITGRHAAEGDPLTPSRLLLACDNETLVKRIGAMCDERVDGVKLFGVGPIGLEVLADGSLPSSDVERLNADRSSPTTARSQFRVPSLPALPPPQRMSVTEFRSYLACPYRYALERVLKLEGYSDGAVELDPLMFGSLAHDVLCEFGSDEALKDCADAAAIEAFLLEQAASQASRRFGRFPMPAVLVQLSRLEQRLRSFAKFQAAHRAQGWVIRYCEHSFDGTITLDIPGQPSMPIHGKIDRIDFNERTGEWLIIDYKTSEGGDSPHKSHHGKERLSDDGEMKWEDLQLPLYHYLARRADFGIAKSATVNLAYICLPKQTDGACLRKAQWTSAHLEEAVELAREVVRKIRSGEFAMNPEYANRFDDFARICQTAAFGDVDGENGGGGDE